MDGECVHRWHLFHYIPINCCYAKNDCVQLCPLLNSRRRWPRNQFFIFDKKTRGNETFSLNLYLDEIELYAAPDVNYFHALFSIGILLSLWRCFINIISLLFLFAWCSFAVYRICISWNEMYCSVSIRLW